MVAEQYEGISRRTVSTGIAWSLPVIAAAAAAPARAASCQPVDVNLLSASAGNGYDVRLADGKVRPNAGTNYLASGNMASLTFGIVGANGLPVPNLSAVVACDGTVTDDEGNSMVLFAPVGSPTQSERPGPTSVTVTANTQGQLTVWAATATYRRQDRVINPALDNHGTFTVTVPAQGDVCETVVPFTFQVIDAVPFAAT